MDGMIFHLKKGTEEEERNARRCFENVKAYVDSIDKLEEEIMDMIEDKCYLWAVKNLPEYVQKDICMHTFTQRLVSYIGESIFG